MAQEQLVGGWDDYINVFLKADDVKSQNDEYVCIKIEEVVFDDKKNLRLTLERVPDKFLFDLNKTNLDFIKSKGIKHPKEIVGKRLKFRKVTVTNPTSKKEVEGLRIDAIN